MVTWDVQIELIVVLSYFVSGNVGFVVQRGEELSSLLILWLVRIQLARWLDKARLISARVLVAASSRDANHCLPCEIMGLRGS